jgi:hypothetical protein
VTLVLILFIADDSLIIFNPRNCVIQTDREGLWKNTQLLKGGKAATRPSLSSPFPHDARTCHLPNSTSTTSLGSLIRRSSLVLRQPPTPSHACVHGNTRVHSEPEPRRRNDVMQHFQENTLIPMSASSILEAFCASHDEPTTHDLGQTGHSTAHSIQPAAVLRIGEPGMPRKIASHCGRSGRSGGS